MLALKGRLAKVVIRCNSPVMIVFDVPSLIWAKLVLWLTLAENAKSLLRRYAEPPTSPDSTGIAEHWNGRLLGANLGSRKRMLEDLSSARRMIGAGIESRDGARCIRRNRCRRRSTGSPTSYCVINARDGALIAESGNRAP